MKCFQPLLIMFSLLRTSLSLISFTNCSPPSWPCFLSVVYLFSSGAVRMYSSQNPVHNVLQLTDTETAREANHSQFTPAPIPGSRGQSRRGELWKQLVQHSHLVVESKNAAAEKFHITNPRHTLLNHEQEASQLSLHCLSCYKHPFVQNKLMTSTGIKHAI